MGSLTGAVSSQRVTEEPKGALSPVGNRAASAKVEGRLTARPISRAGAKAGLSDPVIPYGRVIAHQIKGTPGITGLSLPSVHSGGAVWHLDVGSSHPGGGEAPKGSAVSTGRLRRSPAVHARPIDPVVYREPSPRKGAGDLVSRGVSRLDAFSVYPGRT